MLAFIRGPESFVTSGQVYVKFMPDGEPVQLTHDDWNKLAPVFSPDGSRIAYTELQGVNWNTNEQSITGGEPRLLLPNAEGLRWIDKNHMIFSEMRTGVHMGVVTAGPARSEERDLYFPEHETGMAHFGIPSPDRKRVVIVEMDNFGWLRCRLMPLDGSSKGVEIGPSGECSSAAWSPDGKWIYLTSNGGGASDHIWRVKFPNGTPEQITSGPTSEAGVAPEPDGKSFITSVGNAHGTVWFHDKGGDRQISGEGYADNPMLTENGKTLFYLQRNLSRNIGTGSNPPPDEVSVVRADLRSGASEEVLNILNLYDIEISGDGSQIVYSTSDAGNHHHMWVVPTDHTGPPRPITSPDQDDDSVHMLGNGDFVFRRREHGQYFVYAVKQDGSGLHKVLPIAIRDMNVSPDGEFVVAFGGEKDPQQLGILIYRLSDGSSRMICEECYPFWSRDGKRLYISFALVSRSESRTHGQTYVLPWNRTTPWKELGARGTRSEAEIAKVAAIVPPAGKAETFEPGPSEDVYAYGLRTIQRNLYRVPVR